MMISVIIPVYNGEKYIEGLIENLSNQTGCPQSEFEFVFVDDGSSDNTLEMLNQASTYSSLNIVIHHQTNGGVSSARNSGIDIAKGEYITFLDSDDVVTDDYLKTLASLSQNNSFDVLVFKSLRITNENEYVKKDPSSATPKSVTSTQILSQFLSNPTQFGVVNLLLKKNFVRLYDLKFSIGYKYYEDYEFLYKAFGKAKNIMFLDKYIYLYILRPNSAMQKFSADRITCMQIIENLNPMFKESDPIFYKNFKRWGTSRIYWSVLWQAALSAEDFNDFSDFAKKTKARKYLKNLLTFPSKKVQLSSITFFLSKRIYYSMVNLLGKSHSNVIRTNVSEIVQNIS